MKILILLMTLSSGLVWAQLVNSVELTEKLNASTEDVAKKELLHLATMKSFEKFIPELGYKYDEFKEKLDLQFKEYFEQYKERKLIDKFGVNFKQTLSETDRTAFLTHLESEKSELYIKFSHTSEVLRSHSFVLLQPEGAGNSLRWKAKINLDIDKIKLDKFLRRIILGEKKAFSKIILLTEIDLYEFTWTDLSLDNDAVFLKPLNDSWLKWVNDNLPSTVEEVVLCDSRCMDYYGKWSESESSTISVPEEYNNSVFLKVSMQLKRSSQIESLHEMSFEWEGRTLLHDLGTKRILASFALPLEKRTFRQMDQKAINSGLASSLYRSPLTAFMQFNRKLEEKIGFNRVSKLVIKGFRNLGEVHLLGEMLKTRGTSLGLDVSLDSFSKDEANLLCFYRGEEKSFTDILSALKELKSTHSYTLVNEFTGIHHVIKFVTE